MKVNKTAKEIRDIIHADWIIETDEKQRRRYEYILANILDCDLESARIYLDFPGACPLKRKGSHQCRM